MLMFGLKWNVVLMIWWINSINSIDKLDLMMVRVTCACVEWNDVGKLFHDCICGKIDKAFDMHGPTSS